MNNDLISRSELKKVFGYTDEWYKGSTVCAYIDDAPTVEGYKNVIVGGMNNPYNAGYMDGIRQAYKELERATGEWINREAVSNTIFPFWERYECNKCHKYNGYSNFCPNCGADMRKGEEG